LLIVIGNTCRNSFLLLWLVYRRGLRLLLLCSLQCPGHTQRASSLLWQSGTLSRILHSFVDPVHSHGSFFILLLPVHTHGIFFFIHRYTLTVFFFSRIRYQRSGTLSQILLPRTPVRSHSVNEALVSSLARLIRMNPCSLRFHRHVADPFFKPLPGLLSKLRSFSASCFVLNVVRSFLR